MIDPTPDPAAIPERSPAPEQWFAREVQPHDGQLKAWLRGTFPAVRDVDDVAQESYLRVWRARATRPIASAKAFLFQVARRVALDVLRKERNAPLDREGGLAVSRVLDPAPDAAHALISKDLLHHLADAMASLPDRDRQVVILHKLKGLSQREVALQLQVPERTVEKRCARGLRACEHALRRRGFEGSLT